MRDKSKLPQLAGQWITLVKLKGPVQLPSRPKQMIDSYCTIWQKGEQLWAGDGFGSVNEDGVVTMYGDTAQYDRTNGEIIWSGQQGLNALVKTVDLAGVWMDEGGGLHELAQRNSPVRLILTEKALGDGMLGTITGHEIRFKDAVNGGEKCGTLSTDCHSIKWSDGSVWNRHLHIKGCWISIINKLRLVVDRPHEKKVIIGDVPGTLDLGIWYINAADQPFPDDKKKGGVDFDSTAIHWADYVGWQRVFILNGTWVDQSNNIHEISRHRIKDPRDYRRFTWLFETSCHAKGTQVRNWVELNRRGKVLSGQVTYDSSQINWEDGDIWHKEI